jgi:hypothetical protein
VACAVSFLVKKGLLTLICGDGQYGPFGRGEERGGEGEQKWKKKGDAVSGISLGRTDVQRYFMS